MIFRANFQISCTHPYNFRVFWHPFIEDVIEKGASRESSEEGGGRKEEGGSILLFSLLIILLSPITPHFFLFNIYRFVRASGHRNSSLLTPISSRIFLPPPSYFLLIPIASHSYLLTNHPPSSFLLSP